MGPMVRTGAGNLLSGCDPRTFHPIERRVYEETIIIFLVKLIVRHVMKKFDLGRNITALKYMEVRKRNIVLYHCPVLMGSVCLFLIQSGIRIIAYRFS